MVALEKIHAAQTRTASYYLKLLREMNHAYLSGGENSYHALQRFDADYNQIERCLEWLEAHATVSIEIARLFLEMASAGQTIFSRHLKPLDYLHLHEKALGIAEDLQDNSAALTHLTAIAYAHQLLKNTSQFHDTLVRSYTLAKKVNDSEKLAATLFSLALVYMDWGQMDKALETIQEALYHYRLYNDTANMGKCLIRLGKIKLFQGDWQTAEDFYHEAYSIAVKYHHHEALILILRNLGEVKGCMGLYDEAIQYLFRALEIATRLNDHAARIPLLMQTGYWLDLKGDNRSAQDYHHQVLQLIEQTGIRRYTSNAVCYLGQSLSLEGENAKALTYLEDALEMFRQEKDLNMQCTSLAYLTLCYLRLGHFRSAEAALLEALEIALTTKNEQLQRRVLVTASHLWVMLAEGMNQERLQEASQWFGLCLSLPNVLQELLNELEKLRPELEATLGQKTFHDLIEEGAELHLEAVLNNLQIRLKEARLQPDSFPL